MNNKPKLLHLVKTTDGGAGKAAYELHQKFVKHGFNSQIVCLKGSHKNIQTARLSIFDKFFRRIKIFLFGHRGKLNSNYQMINVNETLNIISNKRIEEQLSFEPNYILVYWISNFLNAKNLYDLSIKYNSKVILHLTDMVSFTGGCHFTLNCKNYTNSCGNCPGLFSKKKNDKSQLNFFFKQKYYDLMNIEVVVGTTELEGIVKTSSLLKHKKIHKIPYHVDFNKIPKNDKKVLRSKYDVPDSKVVLMVGATEINQERKGFKYLIKSLQLLDENLPMIHKNNLLFLVVGNNSQKFTSEIPFEFITFEKVSKRQLDEFYLLSDIFLNTSIQDIGPYMLIEAMLNELLVVSYNVGLANDLIEDKFSGFIVQNKSIEKYAEAIHLALNIGHLNRKQIGRNGRKSAIQNHQWINQISKYEKIFAS